VQRREFLKNSLGALLFGAISSNKVLASVVDTLTPTSPKVLLYLIQNKKGQWKVRGTKWIDIAKKRVDPNKVLIETFKPLEIVSNDIANKRKNELWIQYGCSGEKGAPLDVIVSTNRVKDNHTKSEKTINYLKSNEWKENWKKGHSAGGKISGKIIGQKNKETGWMNKIRPDGQLNYFNTIPKEERILNSIKGGKAASIINLQSGQVLIAQKLAGESRRKKVIDISTGIIYNSVKEVSLTFNLHYGSLKNTLNENGRKNKTTFKYILES
jgi:hypothetical protein